MFTHTNLQACKTHIQTYEHANQQPYKHTHHTKTTKTSMGAHTQTTMQHNTKHKDIRANNHHTTKTIPIPEYKHTSMQTNTPTKQTRKYTYTRTYIQQVNDAIIQKTSIQCNTTKNAITQ